MVDGRRIVRALFEEAQHHIRLASYSPPDTDLGFRKNWQRVMEQFPMPSRTGLARVIEETFWASMLAEEGRPCRPRLLYLPNGGPRESVHAFRKPVPLTAESLRKLYPTQGARNFLTWELADGEPVITAVLIHTVGSGTLHLTIKIQGNGALDLLWSGIRLATLRGGELSRYSRNAALSYELIRHRHHLGEISFGGTFLERTVAAIANQGHGGALDRLKKEFGHPS